MPSSARGPSAASPATRRDLYRQGDVRGRYRACNEVMQRPPQIDRDEREQIAHLAEIGVTALAFVFVGLLIVEYAVPLTTTQMRWVELGGWLIWLVFAVDFVVRLATAESWSAYLRHNWLAALAVILPAFRVFRAARAVRAVRSLRVARLVTGTNRGAGALRRIAGFAGAGYVVVLTLLVWLLGSAGITYLERGQPGATIRSLPEGLWWSATTLIQQGSDRQPATHEGRVLAVLMMVFALTVSGYITAALATFLLDRRADRTRANGSSVQSRVPPYVPPRHDATDTSIPDRSPALDRPRQR